MGGGCTRYSCGTGYISCSRGANSTSTPRFSSSTRSASSVRGYRSKSSLGPNCSRLTKMLVTTQSPWRRAISTSDRCPACKLPIVGTNATRSACARRSRSASAAWMTTIRFPLSSGRSKTVLGARKRPVTHGHDVGGERTCDTVVAAHEIAHEARRLPRRDAERVIDYQHLPGAIGSGTDADHRDADFALHASAECARHTFND